MTEQSPIGREHAMESKYTILIVDDTPDNLRVLGNMLEQEGYEVVVATSGKQALSICEKNPPSLILLDIIMPELDGYAVCRELKASPELKQIPVIVLSALDIPEQKLQAFREGAVDYITKPFQTEEVVARVRTHLNLTSLAALTQEVEERKRAEKKMTEQAEELSAIYENAPLVMMVVKESGVVKKINNAITEFTDRPLTALLGKRIGDIFNCINAPLGCGTTANCEQCKISQTFRDTLATGKSRQQVPVTLHSVHGGRQRELHFLLSSARLSLRNKPAVLLSLLDVSELYQLQNQIIQQQKLESIGTLAGGIAHDFNNILSAILGFTDLALAESDPSTLSEQLGQIRKAAIRATDLVRQILTISRKQPKEKQPLQPSLIIKEALKLLRASIPTTIEFRQKITCEAWVMADATQLHQVIMNLGTNAYHAMMENGGVLSVSLEEMTVSGQTAPPVAEGDRIDFGAQLAPGHYVRLIVSDTGCGMDKTTLTKIFDPYFTTKEIGRGTGLGLAVVLGIVKTHQGRISVTSEIGRGTTIDVSLPAVDARNLAIPTREETIPRALANERIMVVDDEEPIRELNRQFLTLAGYQVDLYCNGREAWESFSRQPDGWDLILTDRTMPEMTGGQLAAKVLEIRPDCPIIICSGYGSVPSEEELASYPGHTVAFLYKPLTGKSLLTQVAKTLSGAKKPGL